MFPRFCLAILILFVAACSARTPQEPIADLVTLTQDAGLYHGLDPNKPILNSKTQEAAFAHFLTEHFSPWTRTEPKYTAKEVFWGLELYPKRIIFGENTLLRDPSWLKRMGEKSQVPLYPSMNRRAIAVTNTSMRVLPTSQPVFYDFTKAGEGFPFDYMQNSLVLAGTPLLASHISADRAWILVESRFAYGWIPVKDIGWVDDDFISKFRTGQYAAITRDNLPITDTYGDYRFTGHVGTILPIMTGGDENKGLASIIPVRTARGEAVAHIAFLPGAAAEIAPIPSTPANFAKVINAMLGRAYGWGGLYENRDCSAATMDLMAAFGIYLPRNSSQQIKVGVGASLKGMSLTAKKQFITKTATPFLTLVRKSGHIMLYIGNKDGQPMVFHAVWGLKTRVGDSYGRKIIGKAVITSLEPGVEMKTLARPEGVILETVYAISTLPGLNLKE
jgi:cell wall-associated NlpC family hydrolase